MRHDMRERALRGLISLGLVAGLLPLGPAPAKVADASTTRTSVAPVSAVPLILRPEREAGPPSSAAANVALSASAWPSRARAGDVVTVTILASALTPSRGLSITLALAAGLDYVPGSSVRAEYDAASGTLIWRGIALSGLEPVTDTFQVRVSTPRAPENFALAPALGGLTGDACCTVRAGWIRVVQDLRLVMPAAGGRVALGEQAWVDVEPGAVSADTPFTFTAFAPITPSAMSGNLLLWPLEFAPDMVFSAPVRLGADLSRMLTSPALIDRELRFSVLESVPVTRTMQIDGKDQAIQYRDWRATDVPFILDRSTGLLAADLAHFSEYQVTFRQPSAPEPWKLNASGGEVNLFRGAAQFGLPLALPQAQNSYVPALAVGYSSASADTGSYAANGAGSGATLGRGWTLGTPKITRFVKRNWEKVPKVYPSGEMTWEELWAKCGQYDWSYCRPLYETKYWNVYTLELDGTTYRLRPRGLAGAGGGYEYASEDNAPVRVVLCNDLTPCSSQNAKPSDLTLNATHEYWVVFTPDGTRLFFGVDAQSVNMVEVKQFDQPNADVSYDPNNGTRWAYAGALSGSVARAWFLSRGYSVLADDPAVTGRWSLQGTYRTVSLTVIVPNDPLWSPLCTPLCPADTEPLTDITSFGYGPSIRPDGTAQAEKFTFDVAYGNCGGVGCPITQIDIKRGATDLNRYRFVMPTDDGITTIIEERRAGGGNWNSLPSPTFGYVEPIANGQGKRVAIMANGYGASWSFSYTQHLYASGYVVTQTVASTTSPAWARVETFAYGEPCQAAYGQPCRNDLNYPDGANDTQLMGFGAVTRTVRERVNGPALAIDAHRFFTDYKRLGRDLEARSMDGSQNVLSTVRTEYLLREGGVLTTNVWFVAPQTVTEQSMLNVTLTRQSVNFYDAFANLTRTVDFGYTTVTGTERTTEFGFYPNASAWIVNKPAFKNVWKGAFLTGAPTYPADFLSQELYFYDNSATWGVSATKGLVTKVGKGDPGYYGYSPNGYAEQSFGYDALGNLAVITDTRGNATRAGYDPTGLFMTAITNALGQVARYDYYGVGGVSLTNTLGTRQPFGSLRTITDANSAATIYGYDAFGRLTRIARPGDSLANPSEVFGYYDGGDQPVTTGTVRSGTLNPLLTSHAVYSGTALASWSRTFYDGLGREIQTQAPFVEAGGIQNDLLTYTTYDALGRVLTQSTPYSVSAYVYMTTSGVINTPYVPPDLTRPATRMTYDALGRTTLITAPDGTRTLLAYAADTWSDGSFITTGLFVKGTIDPNNHGRHDVTDAFGRLVRVREFTGTYGVGGYTSYAETKYAYDALDNLRIVTDALTNTTVITYDALSRKTAMRDPDMGLWSYGYDPAGNLITQTDAANQVLTFSYDALNRLTTKKAGGTTLASYGFDSGAFGIGRRITATVPGAVTDTLGYDARGRVLTQTRTIDGLTYTTLSRYDGADRMTGMTLPTGEVITHTYNAAGQLTATKGLSTYVSSVFYNPLGAANRLDFGNGVTARYNYFDFEAVRWAGQPFGKLRQVCVLTTTLGMCAEGQVNALLSLLYVYDPVGNITTIEDRTFNPWQTTTYTYDPLDRLVTARGLVSETFGYNPIGNLVSKLASVGGGTNVGSYTYGGTKPHAVTATGNGWSFVYDANGNMTRRVEGSTTFTQAFNIENKLSAITKAGNITLTQLYDADSLRVKKKDGYTTTIYVGGAMEIAISGTTRITTTYYFFGGQRVAMRVGSSVTWLHGDHLGSASLATNAGGGKVTGSDARYTPFGEYRSGLSGVGNATDNRFTGQKRLSTGWGLDDFNARFYSPALGRFVSADSMVPSPSDPQSLNRYASLRNSPLRFVDPTGHYECDGENDCRYGGQSNRARGSANDVTSWLGRVLSAVAHSQDIEDLITLNSGRLSTAAQNVQIGYLIFAALKWKEHVQDHGIWDFKHKMYAEFGKTMVLCGSGRCYGLDYSTAGNITYGFWGTQIGYSSQTLSLGAGWAEVHDPAHANEIQSLGRYGVGYYNPDWRASNFDDPQDQAAIQLGVDIYKQFGPTLTEQQFIDYISSNISKYKLAFGPIPASFVSSPTWPYSVDYFNGGGQ